MDGHTAPAYSHNHSQPSTSTSILAIHLPQIDHMVAAGANPYAAPPLNSAQRRREEKYRKKDQRSWENINKSLAGLSDAEKYAGLSEKYKTLYDDYRKLNMDVAHLEVNLKVANSERSNMQAEMARIIEGRNKLENLCRELQKKYRDTKDLTIMQLKNEEDRRRALSYQFNERLAEITRLMDEANQKSNEMRTENALMQSRVAELTNQFMDRDKGISQMVNEMDAQRQLHDAKLDKMKMEIEEERRIFQEERMKLEAGLKRSEETVAVLRESNQNLQTHLNLYKSQYSEFEETINKSNQMFGNFKEEIAKVTKRNIELESEIQEWQMRVKTCSLKLLDEAQKFELQAVNLDEANRTVLLLKRLCRQLQNERQKYLQLLKNNNISISEVEIDDDLRQSSSFDNLIPPVAPVDPSRQQKLDDLKNDLAELQQLSDLSQIAQSHRLKQDSTRLVNTFTEVVGTKKKGKSDKKKNVEENVETVEEEDTRVQEMHPSTGAIKKKRNRNRKGRKAAEEASSSQEPIAPSAPMDAPSEERKEEKEAEETEATILEDKSLQEVPVLEKNEAIGEEAGVENAEEMCQAPEKKPEEDLPKTGQVNGENSDNGGEKSQE